MSKSSLQEEQPPVLHQVPTLVTSYIRDNSENFEIANVVIGIATVIVALFALSRTWKIWQRWGGWRSRNRNGVQECDIESPSPGNHQGIYYDFSMTVYNVVVYNRDVEWGAHRDQPVQMQGIRGLL
ncbi:hypothetical protein DFP73DRAFT_634512 [Morchella snyderi]|nr:hypothetical protein DFP73DRAFT_634512 [Morchella snyderi]